VVLPPILIIGRRAPGLPPRVYAYGASKHRFQRQRQDLGLHVAYMTARWFQSYVALRWLLQEGDWV